MTIRDKRTFNSLAVQPNGFIANFILWLYTHSDLLQQVYKRVGPEMPSDLEATPIPDAIPDDPTAVVNLYNYDEGHAGRYTVPAVTDQGGSLSPEHVLEQTDFLSYIKCNLLYSPPHPLEGELADVVLLSPGLNTVHQPYEDETTAPQRAQFYTRVLQRVPIAQIDLGTSFDQPDIVVDGSKSPVLSSILRFAKFLLPDQGLLPHTDENGNFVWDSREIDTIQTVLSDINLVDTPLKRTYRALFATIETESTPALTFMSYSRSSIEIKVALRTYIEQCEKRGERKRDIEKRLRDRLTVVTIGTPTAGFPNGPAYVHVSARTDPLNSSLGVNERRKWGSGKDAIFLNFDSPYNDTAFDNHNLATSTAQYLSIMLAYNHTSSMRQLWEAKQKDELRIPENIPQLIRAFIVISHAKEWLWDPEEALEGVPDDRFPDMQDAIELLSGTLGDEFVQNVVDTFGK